MPEQVIQAFHGRAGAPPHQACHARPGISLRRCLRAPIRCPRGAGRGRAERARRERLPGGALAAAAGPLGGGGVGVAPAGSGLSDGAIDPRHRRCRLCREPRLQSAGAQRLSADRPGQSLARPCARGQVGSARGRRDRGRGGGAPRARAAPGRGGDPSRRVRLRRRIDGGAGALFREQRDRHVAAARGGARRRDQAGRLLLDLRDLRRAASACRSARTIRNGRSTPTA